MKEPRNYHAAVWDEPVIMTMGGAGRRGLMFDPAEPKLLAEFPSANDLVPAGARRLAAPKLPEMSEPEILHH